MSTIKKLFVVFGRLPLLFIVDSVLKGTFSNSTFELSLTSNSNSDLQWPWPWYSPSIIYHTEHVTSRNLQDHLTLLLWAALLIIVTVSSLILICSPIESLLEVYGCCLGFGLLIFSYHCNDRLVSGLKHETLSPEFEKINGSYEEAEYEYSVYKLQSPSLIINIITQLFIVLAFDQICIVGTLYRSKALIKFARYPTDVVLFMSFTMPIFLHSFFRDDDILYKLSPKVALVLPGILLMIHSFFVLLTIVGIVIPALRDVKVRVREMGFDGLMLHLMEKANLSWLLRLFFFTKFVYQILISKTLADTPDFNTLSWSEVLNVCKLLSFEVLHAMCETILSVMSMASIVSIISGWCLRVIYSIIGAYDEEESLQPAVSGFLFVLLAMQTGITSITTDIRLQLLFQNCVLLLVANQHFVQTVAADLLFKASTDDVVLKKHIRPMLPYLIFFSFPFVVVVRLWQFPFRVSWLLAISAFSLELIIKSLSTLAVYTANMLQTHTNYVHDNIDDLLFYIKAVFGCLEFTCGIFLFLNGAYIFIFESGGVIRLVMMVIHLYCNIYQTALKGVATYRLRQSAWHKVNRLQAASQEQLDENNDICPICYQEMSEAVVIQCSHVFHKGCLQKWLSIQEKCPLCHLDIIDDHAPNSNNNTADHAR